MRFRWKITCAVIASSFALATAMLPAHAEEAVVRVGAGGYVTAPPPRAPTPPGTIWATDDFKGKMPTNDWWSSLAWVEFSDRHYPHPLAVQAQAGGLRVFYPGHSINGTKDAIFGFMPNGGADLVLGDSATEAFPDARVQACSDWFVTARFGPRGKGVSISYGHGSPFVYAMYDGEGTPRVSFASPPKVWSGDADSAVLGITIGKSHYGLFAPAGTKWEGIGGKAITARTPAGKRYFSLAVLPAADEATLATFRKHAYAHVTDTKVAWQYDPKTGGVTTTFTFQTTPHEGAERGTLFTLYPHQWRNSQTPLLGATYPSVRGFMKLAAGTSFTTKMTFSGVLPALPKTDACDPARIADLIRRELKDDGRGVKDTYWDGKQLGRRTALIGIAEQYGLDAEAAELTDRVRTRLEGWFTPTTADGKPKTEQVFQYNAQWGTLIGYPSSYGSANELNDHHFHYGYFFRAAAEVARRDPKWAADERWGGVVKLLIRDVTTPDPADPLFPRLRNFDPYAGHSWAAGHAKFGDGNNNESSSEAMNAWYGLILWGEATGDRALRDLGIWLYTTEMAAIQEYWFDVHGDNFAKGYTPSVVTMVWGGKGANGTWFSGEPEAIHGINFLPITAGSLYLGYYPAYAKKNYDALVSERGSTKWKQWADIFWMYRALTDPADAMRQFDAGATDSFKPEGGNSLANAYHWIGALSALGQPAPSITADYPLTAVFQKQGQRTYAVWTFASGPKEVRFSDGQTLAVEKPGMTVRTAGSTRCE